MEGLQPYHESFDDPVQNSLSALYTYGHVLELTRHRPGREARDCAWSADGLYFAWPCDQTTVQIIPWNRQKHCPAEYDSTGVDGQHSNKSIRHINVKDVVWSLTFGSRTVYTKPHSTNLNWFRYKVPNDIVLATGLQNGRIRVWNIDSNSLLFELMDHTDVVQDLKFAPDGSMRLASASKDGTVKIWDLEDDGNMGKTFKNGAPEMYSVCWSPDAKVLATTGSNKCIVLWDMQTYKQIARLSGHHHNVCDCKFSPDGALLATASYDSRVIIWDAHLGTVIAELLHLRPPPSPIFAGGYNGAYVRGLSFSHNGRYVATVCDDGLVRFWDICKPEDPINSTHLRNPLNCSFSPDGAIVAASTSSGGVTIYRSPVQLSSLKFLCRMAVRRLIPTTLVDGLSEVPPIIRCYLKYERHI